MNRAAVPLEDVLALLRGASALAQLGYSSRMEGGAILLEWNQHCLGLVTWKDDAYGFIPGGHAVPCHSATDPAEIVATIERHLLDRASALRRERRGGGT